MRLVKNFIRGTNIKLGERKLLGAFGILIFLTVAIGIIGILQIQGLSQRLENLGKRNLQLEKAVLEMRINNTIYAAGIRNYVFWKVSRYLGALPLAINLNNILAAGQRFQQQLKIYQDFAYLPEQKEWAKQIENSFAELNELGKQIVNLADQMQPGEAEATINNLLMAFENRLYRIDEFLETTMGKQNLQEIEGQLKRTNSDKNAAILFLNSILICTVIVGALIAFCVYNRRRQEALYRKELLNQMINLEERERKSLSLALHDQMGQDLSALKIYLGIIEQNLTTSKSALEIGGVGEKLEQAKKIVSELIDKSYNITFLLRPPALDEVGLVESLEALLLDYKHLTGMNYTYERPAEKLNLPTGYNLLIYRIAQELLTNMAKHSWAKNVKLSLNKKQNSLELFYEDDGVGFRYSELATLPKRRKEDKFKLGLLGLKERVELLDGSMLVDTAPGKGTRIVVKLPV